MCVCVLACCSLKCAPSSVLDVVCLGVAAGVDRHKSIPRTNGVYLSFVKWNLWMVFFHLVVSNTHAQTLCRRRRLFLWPDDFSLLANLYYYLCVCVLGFRFTKYPYTHTCTDGYEDTTTCICVSVCACSLSGVDAAAATDPFLLLIPLFLSKFDPGL